MRQEAFGAEGDHHGDRGDRDQVRPRPQDHCGRVLQADAGGRAPDVGAAGSHLS